MRELGESEWLALVVVFLGGRPISEVPGILASCFKTAKAAIEQCNSGAHQCNSADGVIERESQWMHSRVVAIDGHVHVQVDIS